MTVHTFSTPPGRFEISISDGELADFRKRLEETRWPDVELPNWTSPEDLRKVFSSGFGTELHEMKALTKEWLEKYDWRETEKEMNAFTNYRVTVEDLSIHFIHERSSSPNAIPLILCHGWPGSAHLFSEIIKPLAHPPAGQQAYHVVSPSTPGHMFSSPPTKPWYNDDTARVFDKIMTGLGYRHYLSHGGDWGSIVARALGALHPENCKGVHLNFCPVTPKGLKAMIPPHTFLKYAPKFLLDDEKRKRIEQQLNFAEKGMAYYHIQKNTPRTPAYGLVDSPVAMLGWFAEKLRPMITYANGAFSNSPMTNKFLFDICTGYYLTKSIGTSFLQYTYNPVIMTYLHNPKYRLPRFAMSTFPEEIFIPDLKDIKKTGNLVWYKEAEKGGHFAHTDCPDVFVVHLREAGKVLWRPRVSKL